MGDLSTQAIFNATQNFLAFKMNSFVQHPDLIEKRRQLFADKVCKYMKGEVFEKKSATAYQWSRLRSREPAYSGHWACPCISGLQNPILKIKADGMCQWKLLVCLYINGVQVKMCKVGFSMQKALSVKTQLQMGYSIRLFCHVNNFRWTWIVHQPNFSGCYFLFYTQPYRTDCWYAISAGNNWFLSVNKNCILCSHMDNALEVSSRRDSNSVKSCFLNEV